MWGRIPEDQWDDHAPYNPPHDKGTVIDRLSLPSIDFVFLPFQGDYHGQDVHSPDDCSRHPDQTVDIPHEEQKKKWWDLDDDRKKQLEVQISLSLSFFIPGSLSDSPLSQIGGGLLAGAALLGGGYYAWHEREKKKTEEEVSFSTSLF